MFGFKKISRQGSANLSSIDPFFYVDTHTVVVSKENSAKFTNYTVNVNQFCTSRKRAYLCRHELWGKYIKL